MSDCLRAYLKLLLLWFKRKSLFVLYCLQRILLLLPDWSIVFIQTGVFQVEDLTLSLRTLVSICVHVEIEILPQVFLFSM